MPNTVIVLRENDLWSMIDKLESALSRHTRAYSTPDEQDILFRARDALRLSGMRPELCSWCRDPLQYSYRARGDGMCGPCHRRTNGTMTEADILRDIGAI